MSPALPKCGSATSAETGILIVASHDLIDFTDFLPALASLAGADVPADVVVDGQCFAAQLRGEKSKPREWVFTEWSGKAWIRDRRWKLYRSGQLFDVKADSEEEHPLPEHDARDVRVRLGEVMSCLKP